MPTLLTMPSIPGSALGTVPKPAHVNLDSMKWLLISARVLFTGSWSQRGLVPSGCLAQGRTASLTPQHGLTEVGFLLSQPLPLSLGSHLKPSADLVQMLACHFCEAPCRQRSLRELSSALLTVFLLTLQGPQEKCQGQALRVRQSDDGRACAQRRECGLERPETSHSRDRCVPIKWQH